MVSLFVRARDGAQGPGDLGFAPTGVERRPRTFEARMCLDNTKKDIHWISFSCYLRARDGTRTRGLDRGKVALHQLSHSRMFIFYILNSFAVSRVNTLACQRRCEAGDGNRTHVSSLEGWCSTIELHPRKVVGTST